MRRPLILALAVVITALAGCVPAEPTFDSETGAGLDAVVEHFESLDADDQLAAVATSDTRAERELWKLAGIDDALGGEKPADDAFGAMQRALDDAVGSLRTGADGTIAAASFRDGFSDAQGAGNFANMLTQSLGSEAGMGQTDGRDVTGSKEVGNGVTVTISSSGGTVTVTIEINTRFGDVELRSKTESVINPCPDPEGKVHAEGTSTLFVSAPDGRGVAQEVTVKDDIEVNDDAKMASSNYTFEVGYSTVTATGATKAVTVSSGPDGYQVDNTVGKGGSLADEAIKTGVFLGAWISDALEKAAARGWSDGRCITLNLSYSDGPKGLDPDTKVTVTASPVAKSDGRPAGGTVTATLKGNRSISPDGEKVKADATFTYTAPHEKDDSGTVHFEARSKRGVGLADVRFDTNRNKAFLIEGGGGDLSFSGQTCDISNPFSISGTGLTLSFTPKGLTAGSYTISGFAGATWSGGGSYDITLKDKGGSMTTSGRHTVTSPAGKFTKAGKMTFTLTPVKKCT